MEQLSTEINARIFSFLSPYALLIYRSVSRGFAHHCAVAAAHFRHVSLSQFLFGRINVFPRSDRHPRFVLPAYALRQLFSYFPGVISYAHDVRRVDIAADGWDEIVAVGSRLTALYLADLWSLSDEYLLRLWPALDPARFHSLVLNRNPLDHEYFRSPDSERTEGQNRYYEGLPLYPAISDVGLAPGLRRLTSLTRLGVSATSISKESSKAMQGLGGSLRELEAEALLETSDAMLASVLRKCTGLTALSLNSFAGQVHMVFVETGAAIAGLRQLEKLVLNFGLTDELLAGIIKSCPLKVLDLAVCSCLSTHSIAAFQHCPTLERVSGDIFHLTRRNKTPPKSEQLLAGLSKLPKLQFLDFHTTSSPLRISPQLVSSWTSWRYFAEDARPPELRRMDRRVRSNDRRLLACLGNFRF
eukprot:TRINITY_DN11976_c0_g1_i1.p1 TRINITY_DN11976_c0_g1~~TRINITY_DN11976_c0_g1_i1.p1  ORF type:complete len:415 (-),score=56.55 TRINITY_DN11976_c0_g1_i1:70-1314(-)